LFRAFLVAGAFRVMKATPSVISRSIIGSVLLVSLLGSGWRGDWGCWDN
jgi:hypothetical protein